MDHREIYVPWLPILCILLDLYREARLWNIDKQHLHIIEHIEDLLDLFVLNMKMSN